jgi:PemK-like protein.
MQFSDILVQHLYFVNFDPVQQCEFDRQHLALVLKRNNDNRTFVVMPLTSQPNGDGVNKKRLGMISMLPPNLATNVTYAVFNQVRTVNASRFSSIKNGGTPVQV